MFGPGLDRVCVCEHARKRALVCVFYNVSGKQVHLSLYYYATVTLTSCC